MIGKSLIQRSTGRQEPNRHGLRA